PLSLFTTTLPPAISTLSLHDALPISSWVVLRDSRAAATVAQTGRGLQWTATPRLMEHLSLANGLKKNSEPEKLPASKCAQALDRSEEHTSELQSPCNLVCRLLLEKKK